MPSRLRSICCLVAGVVAIGFPISAFAGGDGASLASAHGFLKRGLYELAEKEYRGVLAGQPDATESMQANYGLSVCLVRQDRYRDAESVLAGLYESDEFAFGADVAVMLAQCKSALGDYDGAARVVAESRGRLAGHALADDAAVIGIEALFRAGKFRACQTNAAAFLKSYSDSKLAALVGAYGGLSAAQLGDDAAAVSLMRNALAAGLPDALASRVRLAMADALQRSGQLDDAAKAYASVREAGGALAPKATLGLGSVRWRQGDVAAAMPLIDSALKSPAEIGEENVAFAQLIRGRMLLDAGRYPDAQEALEKSARLTAAGKYPYLGQADYWRAKCYLRNGDAKAAVELLGRATESHADSGLIAEMRYDYAVALLRLERFDDVVIAAEAFLQAHRDHALVPETLKILASVMHQMGRYQESDDYVARWREASKAGDVLPADVGFMSAENAYLTGDYAAAAMRYAAFLAKSPTDARSAIARRRLGLSQYRKGDYGAAMTALTALGDGGQTAATIFAVGDMHFLQRDWQQATTWLDRFVASPEGSPTDDALLKSGIAHMRLGEYETALRRFTSIVERDEPSPHRAQAVFEMGQTLVAMDRLEDAAKAFRRVLRMDKAERFATPSREHLASIGLRSGKPELAAETFAAMADADASDDARANARLRQAEALIQAEKFAEAADVLAQLLESNSSFADRERAKANRVLALARSSDCEGAIRQFKAVRIDKLPERLSQAVRYDRAYCLRKQGETASAADAFGEIVASAPTSALGRHAALELAVIETERGDRDRAIQLLESLATAWRADGLPAGLAVDQVLYRLGKAQFESEQLDASLSSMNALLEKFPESELRGPAAYLAGEAAFRAGQYERVASLMKVALDAGDGADYHASALLRLGDALNRLQRWSESEARFQEFLAAHGDSENAYQAHFGIGWARENDRKFSEAIESYRRVTDRHKGETAARAQFQVGQCLFAMKDYESAVRELIKTDILYGYPEWSAAALFEAGRCFERLNRRGEARQQFRTVVETYGKTKWAAPAGERLQALASAGVSES